ncbi:MAG: CsbD family protein [Pseudonocardia sp.]|uniref:CsbD family protein n=1 Tax=unclassified Pseudonocardia TaxID=2619320 RepID=UPI00086B34C0|nr:MULTISPECIES: CsbD family protein [unclassified Pseudonocardia]MBN9108500.1 CsbD family protein [Pseudonocardia sp.]ODU27990.1 MAG: general stress protein CsbD [Pseudonocardia sp. SCN 72-51]ODV07849.1 MAG: general stress protein CsbD [Pseudonocardia sp. SCN 73-27]
MSFVDKAKNKLEETVGKAKEVIGDATGNEKLEAEGKAEQGSAGMKQAGEHLKDGVADAKDAVEDTFGTKS